MYSLPSLSKCYEVSYGTAVIAAVWSTTTAFVFPGAPAAQVAIAVISAAAAWNARKLCEFEKAQRAELEKERFFSIPQIPRKNGKFYLGHGYLWTKRNTQALHELGFDDVKDIPDHPTARGDLKIFGQGYRYAGPFFVPEEDNNQHIGVYGSTGYGKTFLAKLFVAQAALMPNAACIVIDPKPDDSMLQCARKSALEAGKKFHLLDFVHPENSATYNPLKRYRDPVQLNARGVALCPPATGDGVFFRENAGTTFQRVGCAMDAAMNYLQDIGGCQAEPPPVFKALWARIQLIVKNDEVEPEEKAVMALAEHVILPAGFTPHAWVPRLSAMDVYGVMRPHELLAWLIRIANFGFIFEKLNLADNLPREQTADIWARHCEIYEEHPLLGPSKDGSARWYAAKVQDRIKANKSLKILLEAIKDVYNICEQGKDYWEKVNSSLTATLPRFRGKRQQIVDSPCPDVDWEQVFEGREVVYFALGSMVDRAGAEAFARIVVEDFVSYVGHRSAEKMPKIPVYFITDEIHSFLTPGYVDLLNKSRSVGVRCIAFGQTEADLEDKLGKAGAKMMKGNQNTIIQMRAPGEDAEAFSKTVGKVPILKFTRAINSTMAASDTGNTVVKGFTATETTTYSYEDRPLIPSSAVYSLPIGQAFVTGMGYQAIIQIPILEEPK